MFKVLLTKGLVTNVWMGVWKPQKMRRNMGPAVVEL